MGCFGVGARGGKDKLGYCNEFLLAREWENIGEVEGFKDLVVQVHPKVEGLEMGDKGEK